MIELNKIERVEIPQEAFLAVLNLKMTNFSLTGLLSKKQSSVFTAIFKSEETNLSKTAFS